MAKIAGHGIVSGGRKNCDDSVFIGTNMEFFKRLITVYGKVGTHRTIERIMLVKNERLENIFGFLIYHCQTLYRFTKKGIDNGFPVYNSLLPGSRCALTKQRQCKAKKTKKTETKQIYGMAD